MIVNLLELILGKKTLIEMFRLIQQSTKKTLRSKISRRLLGLEFKSDNKRKSKALKFVGKKILPDY